MNQFDRFKVGDVVRLKSGSSRMMITFIGAYYLTLVWEAYATNAPQTLNVPFECVKHDAPDR